MTRASVRYRYKKRPIDVRRFLAVRWHKMTISASPLPTPSPIARRCAAPAVPERFRWGSGSDKEILLAGLPIGTSGMQAPAAD